MSAQVWFVTGTSSGFGLATVRELLANGYKVAATTRSIEKLQAGLSGVSTTELLPLEVDLTSETSIKSAVEKTIARFGQLDVALNNAGYAQTGAIEDVSQKEILEQFQINLLAVHAVVQAVLPHFRTRGKGYIINISSAVTVKKIPTIGIYTASKAALNGYTDVLAAEVAPFGVKVITVLPGQFNTGFGAGAHRPSAPSQSYQALYEGFAKSAAPTKLPGSVELVAKLLVELGNNPNPPAKIFLGKVANDWAIIRSEENLRELEQWKARGTAVDVE
jgi:NAD(P)-dependent dehydrogenase (short-subunit alcohol dehydrogenase family)